MCNGDGYSFISLSNTLFHILICHLVWCYFIYWQFILDNSQRSWLTSNSVICCYTALTLNSLKVLITPSAMMEGICFLCSHFFSSPLFLHITLNYCWYHNSCQKKSSASMYQKVNSTFPFHIILAFLCFNVHLKSWNITMIQKALLSIIRLALSV